MRRILAAGMMVLVIGLVCPLAYGEESTSNKDWEFSLAPMYLWALAMDGDVTVKGNKADLDVSFSDIWDNLNGALTFHFEGVHKQRWGFFTDLNYIVLNPEESTPLGDIKIDFTEILFELAGFYRIT